MLRVVEAGREPGRGADLRSFSMASSGSPSRMSRAALRPSLENFRMLPSVGSTSRSVRLRRMREICSTSLALFSSGTGSCDARPLRRRTGCNQSGPSPLRHARHRWHPSLPVQTGQPWPFADPGSDWRTISGQPECTHQCLDTRGAFVLR